MHAKVSHMAPRRPTLLISNVLPERPGNPLYNAFVATLWGSLLAAVSPGWNVVREWSQLDGSEGAVSRARNADAIVIMGGEDIDPHFYGGALVYPGSGDHWSRADAGQIALVHTALDRGIPLLGICRGMQILNVALGGTLVQDLPQVGHHNDTILRDHRFARHEVRIEPDSQLGRALDVDPGSAGTREICSAHHQCVATLGEGLDAVAQASDGIVEAIEHRDAALHGVQWHPEAPAADPRHLRAVIDLLDAERLSRPVSVRAA